MSALAAGMIVVGGAGAARADYVLQTTTTLISGSRPNPPTKSTLFVKGDRVRIENGDRVTLVSGDRIITLDRDEGTYQVQSGAALSASGGPMGMMDFQTSVTLKPGGRTETIAGRKASNYKLNMTIKMKLKPGAMGPKSPASAAPAMPTLQLNAEIWSAPSLPNNPTSVLGPASSATAFAPVKPMLEKLKTLPGMTVRMTMESAMIASAPGAPAAPGGASNTPIATVHYEVTSVTEKTLPDTLFAPPPGYREVTKLAPRRSPTATPPKPTKPAR